MYLGVFIQLIESIIYASGNMCGGRVEGGLSQCTAHWLYGSWENSAICTRSVLETKKVHLLLNHTMLVSSGWRRTGPESGFSQGFLFTISFTDWVWDLCHCRLLACLVGETWYMAILLIWLHRHYWMRTERDNTLLFSPELLYSRIEFRLHHWNIVFLFNTVDLLWNL